MSSYKPNFNPPEYQDQLTPLLQELDQDPTKHKLEKLLRRYPKDNQGYFSKNELVTAAKYFYSSLNLKTPIKAFNNLLKKKPTRSQSGVVVATVLTKPFPCPGKCIFCPSDVRMPKSYLSNEPGAQRAANNAFDPYLQTYDRLRVLKQNGHDISKVELIILGGTWSYYPETYQIWFIKRCFDALNDLGNQSDNRAKVKTGSNFKDINQIIDGNHIDKTYNQTISEELIQASGSLTNNWETATWTELESAQKINELSNCRNVGLVIETRPDNISVDEVARIRRLGCTKTQIGIQSLSDEVLRLNKRGHDVAATRRAFHLLRTAGFKIHAHWMPNLYGSNHKKDIEDFKKIFADPDFCPDELKIYPCSLISSAELMKYHQDGRWSPYSHDQLLHVLTESIKLTPAYCRLTRVIRDIPGPDIVTGNKVTNFRQIAEQELDRQGLTSKDIRAREIKSNQFDPNLLKLDVITYQTSSSTEKFLQIITPDNQILAFLRLSLPKLGINQTNKELINSAIIREIHVYGPAVKVGDSSQGKPQHLGLGKKLINQAVETSIKNGYQNLAVISAIGTREYYRKLGFNDGKLYQHHSLT